MENNPGLFICDMKSVCRPNLIALDHHCKHASVHTSGVDCEKYKCQVIAQKAECVLCDRSGKLAVYERPILKKKQSIRKIINTDRLKRKIDA